MKLTRNKTVIIILLIINSAVLFNTGYLHYVLKEPAKDTKQTITGQAISLVSLCVDAGNPRLRLHYPLGGNILNASENITANISDPGVINNFNISFYLVNDSESTLIASDLESSDYDFNATFDTTSVADGNCAYTIQVVGSSPQATCMPFDDVQSGLFTIDNVYTEPTWDNFRNNITTNFTTFSRWSNISDVTIGNDLANILFEGSGYNFDSINIDNDVSIGFFSANFSFSSSCFDSGSAKITINNFSRSNPQVLRFGSTCPGSFCSNINYTGTQISFDVSAEGNYSVTGGLANLSTTLEVWDSTDAQNNFTEKRAFEQVSFYANYTESTSNQALNDSTIYCEITFNESGTITGPRNMSFNTTSNLYYDYYTYNKRGTYPWSVTCDDTQGIYALQNSETNVTILNTPPIRIDNLTDLSWPENTVLTGLNLNDYFTEIEGDNLTFTHSSITSITVVIASDGVISFIPDTGFFGLRRIVFFANDTINTTLSNNITLTVTEQTDSSSSSSSGSSSSGGGGGGGGGGAGRIYRQFCEEEWYCTEWSVCVDDVRTRSCWDLNNCNSFDNEPPSKESCEYIPTCYNNVQDQNEEGIDCGGPCQDCYTCFDRQLNQDETDIDCGGLKCKQCSFGEKCLTNEDCNTGYCNPEFVCSVPTCNDGWQNQDEEGVDCGGPCARVCPQLEQTAIFNRFINPFTLSLFALLLAVVLIANLYGETIKSRASLLKLKMLKQVTIPIADLRRESKLLIQKIIKLEETLTKNNTVRIFASYTTLFQNFYSNVLGTTKKPTASAVKQALKRTTLDKDTQRLMLAYYEKILHYRKMKLEKQDVIAVFTYGKKLLYYIQKQKK